MFAELAVNAVLRLKGSGNLDAIQIIKKLGGGLQDSYLDEGMCYMHLFVCVEVLWPSQPIGIMLSAVS